MCKPSNTSRVAVDSMANSMIEKTISLQVAPSNDPGVPKKRIGSPAVPAEDDEGYTWQEVRKHNTAKSLWMIINRRVYDITTWVDRHPGGREQLLMYAGRDATFPFISHHPFSDTPNMLLKKFDIGPLRGGVQFVEYKSDESGFYSTMTARVKEYFEKNGLDPKNPTTGIVRMIPVAILFVLTFLITNNGLVQWGLAFPMWVRLICAAAFAVCQSLPLLHIMHDATHTAFGHNQRWWWWGGRLTSDVMAGGSVMHWVHQVRQLFV